MVNPSVQAQMSAQQPPQQYSQPTQQFQQQYSQPPQQFQQQYSQPPQQFQQQEQNVIVDPTTGLKFAMTGRSQPVEDTEPGTLPQPQYAPQQPQYAPQQPQYAPQQPPMGRTATDEIPAEMGAVSRQAYQPRPEQASQHYQTFAGPPPPVSYPATGMSDRTQAYQSVLSAAHREQQMNPQYEVPM
jgi:hypothetical protein